jgi:uncharacterized DUF497 family protein
MEFEWDEAKRRSNLVKHGLDFADVSGFDWSNAIIKSDLRIDYGEHRFQAFPMQDGQLRQVTFTRRQRVLRIVSYRKASRKERKLYAP